jgi:CheY-like chemotaxis protein
MSRISGLSGMFFAAPFAIGGGVMSKAYRMVLLVDDDEDDCVLIRDAFNDLRINIRFACLDKGEALLTYLGGGAPYEKVHDRPDLILLSLDLPRLEGLNALKAVKADLRYKSIPIIACTNSAERDMTLECYNAGVNALMLKPMNYENLLEAIKAIELFWFKTAELPPG